MQFVNPTGAWAFGGLLVVLALYLLKQRMEPQEVSSTLLWRKTLASWEANHPFQRLRQSLLFWLQLVLVGLLGLALMGPLFYQQGDAPPIFVFDLSGSMQADGRLERAKEDAIARIEGLKDGTPITVITAGSQVNPVVSQGADKRAVLEALAEIVPENGGAVMAQALSLALSIAEELEGAQVYAYSDVDRSGAGVHYPSVGPGVDNRALVSLVGDGTRALARIANYGGEYLCTVSVEADGRLCDIRMIALGPGEIASVYFDIPADTQILKARIEDVDALAADDVRYWVAPVEGETQVLLAGRENVFLEKALALRDDVLLSKTTLADASVLTGFSLIVVDGPLPKALPKNGALLLVDPQAEGNGLDLYGIQSGDWVELPTALSPGGNATAERWLEHTNAAEIHVARYRPLSGDGIPLLYAGEDPVMMITEHNGRRVAVMGFDLHDSNLPVLKEFPLLLRRVMAWLAPEALSGNQEALCGEVMVLPWPALAAQMTVFTPSGRSIRLSNERFADTQEIGLHHLLQTDQEGLETVRSFALHMPSTESDVRVAAPEQLGADAGLAAQNGLPSAWWLILGALVLILLEWWVYRRGFGL